MAVQADSTGPKYTESINYCIVGEQVIAAVVRAPYYVARGLNSNPEPYEG